MADSTYGQNELGQQLWRLKDLAKQTQAAAQQAEQQSHAIGQGSLARKLLDIQHQICVIRLTLKDSEIQEWTGKQMHIPF